TPGGAGRATVPVAMTTPPPGPRPPSGWPLVLAGPMPRRVEPGAVSVFVACRHPRAVELSIHRGTEPGPDTLVHTGQGRTVPLGRFLHVAVVTAKPPAALAPGAVYGYDLRFRREGDHAGDDGPATDDLGSLGLADQLGYRPGHLPSFVLPPERLEQVRSSTGPAASRTASAATPWPPSTRSWRPPTPTRRPGRSSCS
ncbi:MAG TPA: hypothetical protein VFW32_00365, partial [Actinomycetes bacterium]|nr:hypothetical protein [Actinomycetes bacterium]